MTSVFPGFDDLGDDSQSLGSALASARRTAGLSQSDVAERMGTSQPAVARLEAGSTNAQLSTLRRYAEAIGCRLELGLSAPSD